MSFVPRAVLAADVQDHGDQGELLAGQGLDTLDGLVARPIEQIVEDAAEEVRVRRLIR